MFRLMKRLFHRAVGARERRLFGGRGGAEQLEAAEMDGASALKRFWFIVLPHLSRAITVVILIQTIVKRFSVDQ